MSGSDLSRVSTEELLAEIARRCGAAAPGRRQARERPPMKPKSEWAQAKADELRKQTDELRQQTPEGWGARENLDWQIRENEAQIRKFERIAETARRNGE